MRYGLPTPSTGGFSNSGHVALRLEFYLYQDGDDNLAFIGGVNFALILTAIGKPENAAENTTLRRISLAYCRMLCCADYVVFSGLVENVEDSDDRPAFSDHIHPLFDRYVEPDFSEWGFGGDSGDGG